MNRSDNISFRFYAHSMYPAYYSFLLCLFFINSNSFSQGQVKLIYETNIFNNESYTGGVYSGEKIIIYSDCIVERYSIHSGRRGYWPESYSPFRFTEKLIKTTMITLYDLKKLDELFTEYNFDDYCGSLPPPEKRNNKFTLSAAPVTTTTIIYFGSETENAESLTIYDHMNSKYPARFNRFIEKFKEKIYAFVKELIPR